METGARASPTYREGEEVQPVVPEGAHLKLQADMFWSARGDRLHPSDLFVRNDASIPALTGPAFF